MQEILHEELKYIFSRLENALEDNGGVLSPSNLFQLPSLNLNWALTTGSKFSPDDSQIQELLRLNTEVVRKIRATGGILAVFPWVAKIFPWLANRFREEIFTVNRATQEYLKVT